METNSLQKYHLKNTNLSQSEKVIIESLYQVPITINEQVFILFLLYLGIQEWVTAFVYAGIIGIIVAILAEKSMFKKSYSIFTKLSVIFAGYGSMLIDFILAGIAYYLTNDYRISLIAILSAIGVTSLIAPAMFANIVLNRGDINQKKKKLHFKYVMANKIWGKNF